MTGKERALAALHFEETDRIPVVGWMVRHPAFLARTAGASVEAFWQDLQGVAIQAFRSLGVDVIMGLILPEPGLESGAQFSYHAQSRFASPEEVREEVLRVTAQPAPLDPQREYDAYLSAYLNKQAAVGEDLLWVPTSFGHVAQFQHEGWLGAENYYMALALYPEEMQRLFVHSAETVRQRNEATAKAILDHDLPRVMWIGQDICDSRGPYLAPAVMQELYLQYVQRSFEPLKEAGITIIWHADGNFMPIARQLLEAGADGFQGIQETFGVPVRVEESNTLTTTSGHKPIIVGSVSSATTMPFGTPREVGEEVERCRRLARERGGGWWLNFTSSLGPEVPEANLHAIYAQALPDRAYFSTTSPQLYPVNPGWML